LPFGINSSDSLINFAKNQQQTACESADMEDSFPPQDVMMTEGQSPPPIPTEEPKYGGFTRFEIELEVSTSPPPQDLY
jgi:hypothetical protein